MGYALKDGDPDELMCAIQAAVAGETYVDPRLREAVPAPVAPAPVAERPPLLSRREREIMDHLAQGLTGEQVAELLVLSAETVKTHIRNAMGKLEATTRVHAVALALRDGQISPPA
jgi:DNA-binding NarL/FixJ family response regulator